MVNHQYSLDGSASTPLPDAEQITSKPVVCSLSETRLRMNWQGRRMALLSLAALVCVLFTFAGVNLLLPGLHSYA